MTEEPCQCSDCQRFYKEHDRLIREFPTFKQQQELNWASIQSFRTLCSKVTNELQRKLSRRSDLADIDFDKLCDELVANGWLNHSRFVESFIRARRIRGQGPVKIINELKLSLIHISEPTRRS